MLTLNLWANWVYDTIFPSRMNYLMGVVFTPIMLALDLILLPFEIIALILYQIIEGKWED